ncbi:hypothetical protein [Desulfosporosinus meridiei]|uniref:Uncharacterized protein n=1 Tax=Desulfosporosinus meridiei (strain ATCC BAA-275 / DSM 13257 / KCTC 12902 / NCIMB 13706 / S10) TaxID=768704 RepID=J7J0U6_DESMD|nr:hypothetical protein [Desulfosporosinus meridiei]AFQ44923.1 hypothetical protein Desmer_3040 [Desulfosporosinus meridiei DSM 13257]
MKKRLAIVLATLLLNVVLVGNAFATDVSVNSYTLHTGWSPNWAIKSYNVSTSYVGNQYEQSGQQYVDGHDYFAFIVSAYSPEIPRGQGSMLNLQMLNSGGTVVSTLTPSNFSSGTIRGHLYDTSITTVLSMTKSYSWLQSTAGTYRAKIATLYTNTEFTGMSGTDSYYTPYF